MKPADLRAHAAIRAELSRLARYDDQSVVHDTWIRQRYDCGCYPSLMPARQASVETAWHKAGHAVAALAVGARFSSASIHHSPGSEGRVHGIRGGDDLAFVVDAAGQIAQRLRDWTMLERDEDLQAWLPRWKSDGGDARHFRRAMAARYGRDEVRAPGGTARRSCSRCGCRSARWPGPSWCTRGRCATTSWRRSARNSALSLLKERR